MSTLISCCNTGSASRRGDPVSACVNGDHRWNSRDYALDAARLGETKLTRIFPTLKTWFGEDRFYGCPFINAVAEHDKDQKQFRNIAMKHKKVVLAHIEKLADEMGAHDVERRRLRRQHPTAGEATEAQRPEAVGVARTDEVAVVHEHEREGARQAGQAWVPSLGATPWASLAHSSGGRGRPR